MHTVILFLLSNAFAAGDPSAEYLSGPGASTLGAITHGLAMAAPGSEERALLAAMACAQAQGLLRASGFVLEPNMSVQKVAEQAVLVIGSLPEDLGCTIPDVELPFELEAASRLNLLGRDIDPAALSRAGAPQSRDEARPRKRGVFRRNKTSNGENS